MALLRVLAPNGTYGGTFPGTVPALTAGSIANSAPIPDEATVTVTGSNAVDPFAEYDWQTDGVSTGARGTGATFTVDTAIDAGKTLRRGVRYPDRQDWVYTTGVAVASGAAFSLSSLFASGEDGFALVPSLTTTFESTNNSDPAEVGDAVGFQTCSSGRGTLRNFIQTGNRPNFVQDGSTYALDFEASETDRLQRDGGNLSVIGAGGVTLFARIKLESVGSTGAIIAADTGAGSNRQFQFTVQSTGRVSFVGFATGSGSTVTASPATVLSTGVWYNVCAIFNTTNARVWIDTMTDAGVGATTANSFGTLSSGDARPTIGTLSNAAGSPFDGLIALAVCVNRSLTETERQNLATFASAL
jgi:hypothetical protein